MRKYYSHTLLYLHETIALGSSSHERFTEEFNGTCQPMMQDLGARLFAIHAGNGKAGHALVQLGFLMLTPDSESQALRRGAAASLSEARRDR